jgi:hypothetical protein
MTLVAQANVPRTAALRRLRPSAPELLSPSGLGDSPTRDSRSPRLRSSGLVPQCGHDPEQSEEGGKG